MHTTSPTTDGPVARLDDVHKCYRLGEVDVPALNGISLDIPTGQFTFIIGPSGSGKSTLLNLLGCIDRPDRGEIEVLGEPVLAFDDNALTDFRCRAVGIVFQSFNLIPVLSVLENIEYSLTLANLPRRQRREQAADMAVAVGLGDRLHHRPNQLSGGQHQRVAIARALAGFPALVLADEPTANLDRRTGREILELMLDIQSRLRTSFVFSTHDTDVMSYADHVHQLVDGRLVEGADAEIEQTRRALPC